MNGKKAKYLRRKAESAGAEYYNDFPYATYAETGGEAQYEVITDPITGQVVSVAKIRKGVPRRLGLSVKGIAKATQKVLRQTK